MDNQQDLLPVASISLPDKEQAAKMLETLNKGYELSLKELDAITEVTAENREFIVEKLALVKRIHDKIKATREPITKWLDEKKQQFMSFERASDYNDKKSLYSEKRELITAFDQSVLEETRKKEAEAERQRQVAVYFTELRAGVERQLVDMVAFKKREFIEKFTTWKKGLTAENLDAKVAALMSSKPTLKQEDYDRCFNLNFQLRDILSPEERASLNGGNPQTLIVSKHTEFFDKIKPELPYAKYNEDYVLDVTVKINEFVAAKEQVKAELKEAASNAEKEKLRQEELAKQQQQQLAQVAEAKNAQIEQVNANKDSGVMEAEFVKQAQTQDLPQGPVKKTVVFAPGQFVKPFVEIVHACCAHPDFPGITKKGSDEYVPGVEWWTRFYQSRVQMEERVEGKLQPIIKGIVIIEEAKTTVKSAKK